MELHAFSHGMRDKVRAFEKYWRECRRDDPSGYPEEMGEPDWYEQFIMYMEA